MRFLWVLGGIAAFVFLLDRLLLWLEWRGLIDYRRTYPGRIDTGQVGPAFLAIQSLLEPEKRHAAEEQSALRTERENAGGGPSSLALRGGARGVSPRLASAPAATAGRVSQSERPAGRGEGETRSRVSLTSEFSSDRAPLTPSLPRGERGKATGS
jgi:hypothetical protein